MFDSDIVKNETEAYLLGFFYADGSVSKENIFSIALAEKDKDFLQNIANILNQAFAVDKKLKYDARLKAYEVVYGVRIGKLLNSLGVINRKSYENNSQIFEKIPDELKRHFIRGFFDGDGSITIGSDGKARLGFVGLNYELINSISIFTKKNIVNTNAKVRQDGKYWRYRLSGNNVVKIFCNYIYKDAIIYLDRKYQIYKKIIIQKDTLSSKYKYISYRASKKDRNLKKWNLTIKRDWIGLFMTEHEALEKYNSICENYGLEKQEWKGKTNGR